MNHDELMMRVRKDKPVRSSRYLWLLLLLPYFSTATLAQSEKYKVTELASLPGASGMVRAINNSGSVVGRSGKEFETETRGLIWSRNNQVQTLGPLPGGDVSEAASVNDLGDVVGSSNTNAHLRPLLWSRTGGMKDLGTLPGDSGGRASSMNRAGQVVGSSFGPNGVSAFVWTDKEGMQRLRPISNGDFSEATAINNAGLIAGTSGFAHGNHRAVLWSGTAGPRLLGVLPGDTGSESYAINNSGQVVGASSGPSGMHAFIWNDRDGMHSLGPLPGGDFSMALGINNSGQVVGISTFGHTGPHDNSGQVVGTSTVGHADSHAVIWTNRGGVRDLNDLISSQILLVAAVGINDRGQIIGYGGDRDTYDHDTPISVYLLTPNGR